MLNQNNKKELKINFKNLSDNNLRQLLYNINDLHEAINEYCNNYLMFDERKTEYQKNYCMCEPYMSKEYVKEHNLKPLKEVENLIH